ncbi:MAG: ATP synthase F0 subunit B [Lachnospiraceae bacterium]|nr:ATP synthase F0 subunit B [Lachnospiraceae bacterium]
MPLNIDIVQILLHMLNFVILAGGLTLLLFKPVKKFMEDRKKYFEDKEKEIADGLEKNESLKAEYEEKLSKVDAEIEEMRINAKNETATQAKEYLNNAQEKASTIISEAEQQAEERKDHILDSAQTEIGELVVEAAQKLLESNATPQKTHELYDEFIKSMVRDAQ